MKDDSDPIARLERSHRKLEERLAALSRASCDLLVRSEAAREVTEVVDYFDRAVARHEEDEEHTLFPRLRGVPELSGVIAALAEDHRDHRRLHAYLRTLSGKWSEQPPDRKDQEQLASLAAELLETYRAHVAREETELFPAAREHLGAETLGELLREMEARRPDRGQGGHRGGGGGGGGQGSGGGAGRGGGGGRGF